MYLYPRSAKHKGGSTMQKSISWSYRPYKPYFFDVGDIYICRVAPGKKYIHFEWLDDAALTYSIHYRKRDVGEFALIEKVRGSEYTLVGLEEDEDYEFFIQSGEKKSRVRLARTSEAIGTVVNYLHPDDKAYEFSGRALCSPSILRLPSGALLASMDLYAHAAPQNLTLVFRSEDNGKSWHYQNELFPCFWAKMFLHKGALYILGVSTEYGDLLIGRSDDEGCTFGAPTVIRRGSCSNLAAGNHRTPQNILEYNGRLYTSCEWGAWNVGYHAAAVLSCDASGDLLDADNWEMTLPVKFDPTWEGVEPYSSNGCIEGTVAVSPDGKLLEIMRYDMTKAQTKFGKALAYEIDTKDPCAPIKYVRPVYMDGNHSKFVILKDETSGYYYSIISRITKNEECNDRRLLSLVRSKDLEAFELVCDLYDFRQSAAASEAGMQYIDFFIEGEDIFYLSRTSMNKAKNFHDANYSTFHIIKNFRTDPKVQ